MQLQEGTFSGQTTDDSRARVSDTLPLQIAIGWIASLLVQTVVLLMMVVTSVITEASTNFRSLHYDPGRHALKVLVYMAAFYALMPVFVLVVNRFRSRAFRWVAVVAAVVGFLFLLLHHLSHLYFGQRPDFTSHVMDLTLHVIGLWVIFNSFRWAKVPAPAPAPVLTAVPVTAS